MSQDKKYRDDKFIDDIKTLKWLRNQYYQKSMFGLCDSEAKMLRELEHKYTSLDVTQMLIDALDELKSEIESLKKENEALRQGPTVRRGDWE